MRLGIRNRTMAKMRSIWILIAIAIAIGAPVYAPPVLPTDLNINLLNKDNSNIDTSLRLTIYYTDGDRIPRSINSVDNAGGGSSNTVSWSVKSGKSNLYSLVPAKGGTTISITVCTYETLNIPAVENGVVSGNYTLDRAADTAPPTVTFIPPTPASGSTLTQNYAYINVTADEPLSTVLLEWNGGNESMLGSGTNWYLNKTSLSNGNYMYRVYADDSVCNLNVGETRTVDINFVTYSNLTIEPPQTSTRVVLLANSVDYALNSDFLEFLTSKGLEVVHATASNFDQHKAEKFIVILGGPDAYEGVGNIVQRVLKSDEQSYLRTPGKRKMYVKKDIWAVGQVVYVVAGSDRHQTKKATEESGELISRDTAM